MANADGALLFRNDGQILAVMRDAEAPNAPYGCFCVAWAVWCHYTTVLVFNDGTASFSGESWGHQLHRPPPGTRYVDAGCGYAHVVLLCSDGTVAYFHARDLGMRPSRPYLTEDVLFGFKYTHVACGGAHTVLIRDDGAA